MGLKGVITQSNYIPWRGYFHLMDSVDVFIILDEVQYTKRDWRNRNFILSDRGRITLTIPVKTKGKYHQTIHETEIADKSWKRKHLNSIYLNYKKTIAFETHYPVIEKLYLSFDSDFLSEMNIHLLRNMAPIMNIKTKIISSSCSDLTDRNLRLIDICKNHNISEYHTGASAQNYMNVELFEQEGIQVVFHTYSNMPNYPQQGSNFVDHLSIIDTILNCGDDAKNYIHPLF